MSRADYYFMTNLHLMFDKSTLKHLSELEGSSLHGAYEQKSWIETQRVKPEDKEAAEKEETSRVETLIQMLDQLFKRFGGGGISIERLKDILRGKVKNIKPR